MLVVLAMMAVLVMLVVKVSVVTNGLVTGVAVLVVLVRKVVLVVLVKTGSVFTFDPVCLFRLPFTTTITTAITAAAVTNPNEANPSLYFRILNQ